MKPGIQATSRVPIDGYGQLRTEDNGDGETTITFEGQSWIVPTGRTAAIVKEMRRPMARMDGASAMDKIQLPSLASLEEPLARIEMLVKQYGGRAAEATQP